MKSSSLPLWEYFKNKHKQIETGVSSSAGSYQGLSKEALSTTVEDFAAIFSSPHVQGTFVDLGCGTGEGVLLYGLTFPDRQAIGVEFEQARINEARKFALSNTTFLEGDLLKMEIPQGDTYFLYFPTGPVLDRILSALYSTQLPFHLIVIESHGDLIPRLKLENWLQEISEVQLSSTRHYGKAKIYKRLPIPRNENLLPFTLSYQECFLLMNDDWVGETSGMEWTAGERFELKTPPRTIQWNDVKKLMISDEFTSQEWTVITLRRQGELTFELPDRILTGFIRKIILNPTLAIEISNGEKVEWTKILTIRKGSLLCYESSQSS
jgi:SAM-dependent methyltransferase